MSLEERYPNLKHKNPHLRKRTMQQIAEEYTEETISELVSILYSEDVTFRRTAARTLSVIGLDTVPLVVDELNNSDNSIVRASCADILAKIIFYHGEEGKFPPEAIAGLKQALEDPNPLVYLSTIGALGTFGKSAFNIFKEALEVDNIAVQVAVVDALGSLGDERGLELLSNLAEDETIDVYIKDSAISALSRLEQVIKFNQ
ncbi:MAG: HEAT repeat domain-containing protein [Xenococcaceae cyanobacterium MO_188.B29]|nr:HEAT repeat domain-containing protein [Xenococcaceae cyanobacterium MO_188.B29]